MEMFDYFFWAFAVFMALYGISILAMPKRSLIPGIKNQLAKKGNQNPTDEEIEAKFKQLRVYGIVCVLLSVIFLAFLLRGGLFAV